MLKLFSLFLLLVFVFSASKVPQVNMMVLHELIDLNETLTHAELLKFIGSPKKGAHKDESSVTFVNGLQEKSVFVARLDENLNDIVKSKFHENYAGLKKSVY